MKLWEIKAQALRLMFADSDLQFDEQEFTVENGSSVIKSNSNTRDKYVRMGDSINRAIDLFFDYCGDLSKKVEVYLNTYVIDDEGTQIDSPTNEQIELYGPVKYKNTLDISSITDLDVVKRIDLAYDYENRVLGTEDIDFYYDFFNNAIEITNLDTSNFVQNFKFILYYKVKRNYLSGNEVDVTFEFNDLNIPVDVQRQIPFYIKGELFEEDEPSLALMSKNNYLSFLTTRKKNHSVVQKKVVKPKVWNKR